ncbi:MAG: CfrBI restriction endonuclease [Chloroflexi bacterium ADurb.Bin120]|jgi:hypothetical protein|nr:MAG: CfrBI restriction endonuclease [Chloroflexi bacterium ADurb.Bin120]
MITLTEVVTKKLIYRLINSQDYRSEIITLINSEFLQFAVDFFRKIVEAKLRHQSVSTDWYKNEFLNPNLPSSELIINSGLNKKTISNMYNSAAREIVLEATTDHYDQLYDVINNLVEQGSDIDITLTIKLRGVSVELNINESLIVINTLAVKRAELRGGAWSTAGKQVEKVLMVVLCKIFNVPEVNYGFIALTDARREVDFFLLNKDNKRFLCEVKLMGKGNPESADVIIARDSDVFVADKLSELNKNQLDSLNVKWVELRSVNGYKKFNNILQDLDIPHTSFTGNIDTKLEEIFKEIVDQ